MDTRNTTDYVRGAAILIIIFSHFTSIDHGIFFVRHSTLGMLVSVVSVFFVLSGFGIYHSLVRDFSNKGISFQSVASYFFWRLIKLYPMYWFALAVYHWYNPLNYPIHVSFNQTLSTVFLVPIAHNAPNFLWFMTAIVQCYLWAPLLYLVQRKLGLKGFLFAISIVVVLILIVRRNDLYGYFNPSHQVFYFQNFLMAHVILFSSGMAIAQIVDAYPTKFKSVGLTVISLAGLAFFAKVTLDGISSAYAIVPFIFFNFAFCLYLISLRPQLPFRRIFVLLGQNTMPLYLFHIAFFSLLIYAGIIGARGIIGSVLTILLFPVFVIACILMQKMFNKGVLLTSMNLSAAKGRAAVVLQHIR